jgi:hypothetical protein
VNDEQAGIIAVGGLNLNGLSNSYPDLLLNTLSNTQLHYTSNGNLLSIVTYLDSDNLPNSVNEKSILSSFNFKSLSSDVIS